MRQVSHKAHTCPRMGYVLTLWGSCTLECRVAATTLPRSKTLVWKILLKERFEWKLATNVMSWLFKLGQKQSFLVLKDVSSPF